jgi:hypothetical protein
MGIFFFPSEFIYWTKNIKHDEMKRDFTKWIDNHKNKFITNKLGVVNAHTSYGFKCKFFTEDRFLNELVYKPLVDAIEAYNSRPNTHHILIDEVKINSSWYTEYDSGGYFPMHKHETGETRRTEDGKLYRTMFSVIYILNDDNDTNSTSFFVPNMNLSFMREPLHNNFSTKKIPEIGEGSIIIFPTSLYHEAVPCNKPGRITISYNIDCLFAQSP